MHRHVHAVIVHWNNPDACVATVGHVRNQRDVEVRVTVIDNASDPGPAARLRDHLAGVGDVEVLWHDDNGGFGGGSNRGLEHWLTIDDTEWGAVMPHDAVPAPDALVRILDAVDGQPDIGLVSADVGDGFVPVVQPFLGTIDGPPFDGDGFHDADYAHGTLHLFRRSCVEQIGLFDERYFAYCEETDLGLRAKAAGWRVGVVAGAHVANDTVGGSAAAIDYLKERNTLLLVATHFGVRQVLFRLGVMLGQFGHGLLRPSARAPFYDPVARVYALRDALLGRWGRPPAAVRRRP